VLDSVKFTSGFKTRIFLYIYQVLTVDCSVFGNLFCWFNLTVAQNIVSRCWWGINFCELNQLLFVTYSQYIYRQIFVYVIHIVTEFSSFWCAAVCVCVFVLACRKLLFFFNRTPDFSLTIFLSPWRMTHIWQNILCTGRSPTESDDTRRCVNTIWPPEDEQDIARNMCM
jgi:hypothetical protein